MTPRVHESATFAQTLVDALERYPDRTCFIYEDQQQTYAEVLAELSRLIQYFASVGLRRGDGLAQLSHNCPDAALVQLASWTYGLRYVPLHPLGSLEDQRFIISDAGVDAFVFHAEFEERAHNLVGSDLPSRYVMSHGPSRLSPGLYANCHSFKPTRIEVSAEATDVAAILYTGGTTGKPKGVTLTSQAMVMNVLLTLSGWEWPAAIRFLCSTPITHATGCMMVPILVQGGTMVLQAGFEPGKFLDAVARHRITATFVVPTMLYRLTDEQRRLPRDVTSLETVIYGASPIAVPRLQEALDIFGPVFMQIYSQSEAPCCATVLRKSEHDPSIPRQLASCGRPMAGITVRVLDEAHAEVPEGEVGEICFRGPSIMSGYWNRPEETKDAFRGGWLHTGDLAYRDSGGYLNIVDRAKEIIISGGYNVYPREIEDAISSHPAVAQVAVIGIPDERWGEAVKALVVRRNNAEVSAEELIALVKAKKGAVAAPKSVDFVPSLPLTALGKPDKKAMRAQFWSGRGRQVN